LQVKDSAGEVYVAASGDDLILATTSSVTERLRITSAGKVGINKTSPANELHVNSSGSTYVNVEGGTTSTTGILFGDSDDIDIGQILYSNSDNSMQFVTNTAERLRITSNGEVRVPDGGKFSCGTGDDLMINHDGGNSFIDNFTGTFVLRNYADDSDILLSSDNSSGGTADYVRCDGSTGAVILSHYGSTKLETSSSGVTVTGTLNATTALTQNGTALASTGKAIAMALIFG